MRTRRWLISALVAVGLFAVVACGDEAETADTPPSVLDAFTIPGDPGQSLAVYMRVENPGPATEIVRAELSDEDGAVAASVSMHTTVDDDGLTTMKPVSSLTLPEDETVDFTPGRGHLMVEDLLRPIAEGSELELTVYFDRSPPASVAVRTVTVDEAITALDDTGDS